MLTLTRKPGDSIIIGEDVEIVVVKVEGDRVSISIAAPDSVEVDRSEVRARKLGARAMELQCRDTGQGGRCAGAVGRYTERRVAAGRKGIGFVDLCQGHARARGCAAAPSPNAPGTPDAAGGG